MKNIFLSLTTLLVLAGCANNLTAPEDVDELTSIEMMLSMVDDVDPHWDASADPDHAAAYEAAKREAAKRAAFGAAKREAAKRGDQSFRNIKPSLRIVIRRLQRYIQNHPLSDERGAQSRVEAGLNYAEANLQRIRALRVECKSSDVTVEQCSREIRPIVKRTRQLLHRIIMAVRSDRRDARGR